MVFSIVVQTPPLPSYTFTTPRLYPTEQRAVWDKQPFRFAWGDLKITARQATYDGKTKTLVAMGEIVVERGDEKILAEKLTLEGLTLFGSGLAVNDLALTLDRTTLLSPPFFLTGEQLALKKLALDHAQNLRFVPGPDGRGEVTFDAEGLTGTPGSRRLTFRNATIRLYGARVLTLPRLTLTPSLNRRQQGTSLSLPVTFRTTFLSGPTVGVRLPFTPLRGMRTLMHVESSSRQGIQSLFSVRQELLPQREEYLGSFLTSLGGGGQEVQDERIRRLITARVPPLMSTRRDGFQDRQLTLPVVVHRDTSAPSLTLEANLQHNREFVRRNANLLLQRTPELQLLGRVPVGRQGSGLVAAIGVARFSETWITTARTERASERLQTYLGWEAPIVRVGDAGRVLASVAQTEQRYPKSRYRFAEARLGMDYSFSTQSGVGAGIVGRKISGHSPFLFDTVEADTEGQLRGQVALGRFILGAVGRWDLKTHTLFDSEIGVSLQGRTLEPRLSWRSQNQQFSLSVQFPGLSGR